MSSQPTNEINFIRSFSSCLINLISSFILSLIFLTSFLCFYYNIRAYNYQQKNEKIFIFLQKSLILLLKLREFFDLSMYFLFSEKDLLLYSGSFCFKGKQGNFMSAREKENFKRGLIGLKRKGMQKQADFPICTHNKAMERDK